MRWARLPPPLGCGVFDFVGTDDLIAAGCACRAWAQFRARHANVVLGSCWHAARYLDLRATRSLTLVCALPRMSLGRTSAMAAALAARGARPLRLKLRWTSRAPPSAFTAHRVLHQSMLVEAAQGDGLALELRVSMDVRADLLAALRELAVTQVTRSPKYLAILCQAAALPALQRLVVRLRGGRLPFTLAGLCCLLGVEQAALTTAVLCLEARLDELRLPDLEQLL